MTEIIKDYVTDDIGASQCLVTLTEFIGDVENFDLADDSTPYTCDAVTAINGLIHSLERRDAEIEGMREEIAWKSSIIKAADSEMERLRGLCRSAGVEPTLPSGDQK